MFGVSGREAIETVEKHWEAMEKKVEKHGRREWRSNGEGSGVALGEGVERSFGAYQRGFVREFWGVLGTRVLLKPQWSG